MKPIIRISFFALFQVTLLQLFGQHQNPSIHYTDMDLRRHFGPLQDPLNKTNFLFELGVKLTPETMYCDTSADTVNYALWWTLLEDLYYSAYDTNTIARYDTLAKEILRKSKDTITIGILDYDFDQAISDSIFYDTNFFFVDTLNNTISDNPNRTSSPYTRKSLFSASPLVKGYHFSNPVFCFDPAYHFTDLFNLPDYTGATLRIDFGDGQGWHNITNFNQKQYFNVSFNGSGVQHIKIELLNSENKRLKSSGAGFSIETAQKLLKPTSSVTLAGGNGRAAIYRACTATRGSNQEKFIIFVPGYDLTGGLVTAEQLYSSYIPSSGFGQLRNHGYTFYTLEFNDPFQSIVFNSTVLIELIDYMKLHHCNGDINPQFIIITSSMGALYARLALNLLENSPTTFSSVRPDLGHNTRLAIFNDGGHLGANVPLSMQFALDKMIDKMKLVNAFLRFSGIQFLSILRATATQEGLIEHLNGLQLQNIHKNFQMVGGSNMLTSIHEYTYSNVAPYTSYHNTVNGLTSTGWPEHCKLVAVSNGLLNGQYQSRNETSFLMQELDTYLGGTATIYFRLFGKNWSGFNAYFEMKEVSMSGPSEVFVLSKKSYRQKLKWRWFIPRFEEQSTVNTESHYVEGSLPYGIVAGGAIDANKFGIQQILGDNPVASISQLPQGVQQVYAGKKIGGNFIGVGIEFTGSSHNLGFCHTPVFSTLMYNDGTGVQDLSPDIWSLTTTDKMARTPFDVITGESPVPSPFYNPSTNLGHKLHFGAPGNRALKYPNWTLQNGDSVRMLNREIGDDTLYLENLHLNRNAHIHTRYHLIVGNNNNYLYDYPSKPPMYSVPEIPDNYFSKENPFEVPAGNTTEVECEYCATLPIFNGIVNANSSGYGSVIPYDDPPIVCNPPNDNFYLKRGSANPLVPSIEENSENLSFEVFPNPASDHIVIRYELIENAKLNFTLVDLNGNVVKEAETDNSNASGEIEIDINALPSGLYHLRVARMGLTKHFKFVKL